MVSEFRGKGWRTDDHSNRSWQSIRDPSEAALEVPEVRGNGSFMYFPAGLYWNHPRHEGEIHIPQPPGFLQGSGENPQSCILCSWLPRDFCQRALQPYLGTTLISVAGINTLAEHNSGEKGSVRWPAVPGYSPSLWEMKAGTQSS